MTSDRITALRQSSLLSELSDDDLSQILAIANERRFAAGDALITAGAETSVGMWIILDGTVEVTREGRVLNQLGPGEHVGEMALMSDIRRSADVKAISDVTALQLTRWDLRGLIADPSEE